MELVKDASQVTLSQIEETDAQRTRTRGGQSKRSITFPDGTHIEEWHSWFEQEVESIKHKITKQVTLDFRRDRQKEIQRIVSGSDFLLHGAPVLALKWYDPFAQVHNLRKIWSRTLLRVKADVKEELVALREFVQTMYAGKFRFAQDQLQKQQIEEEIKTMESPTYALTRTLDELKGRFVQMMLAGKVPDHWSIFDATTQSRELTLEEEIEREHLPDVDMMSARKIELEKKHRKSALFITVTLLDTKHGFPLKGLELPAFAVYGFMQSRKHSRTQALRQDMEDFVRQEEPPQTAFPPGYLTAQQINEDLPFIFEELEKVNWKTPTFEDAEISSEELLAHCFHKDIVNGEDAAKAFRTLQAGKKDHIALLYNKARAIMMMIHRAGDLVLPFIPQSMLKPLREYVGRVADIRPPQSNTQFFDVKMKSQ